MRSSNANWPDCPMADPNGTAEIVPVRREMEALRPPTEQRLTVFVHHFFYEVIVGRVVIRS